MPRDQAAWASAGPPAAYSSAQLPVSVAPAWVVTAPVMIPPSRRVPLTPVLTWPPVTVTLVADLAEVWLLYHCGAQSPGLVPGQLSAANSTVYWPGVSVWPVA